MILYRVVINKQKNQLYSRLLLISLIITFIVILVLFFRRISYLKKERMYLEWNNFEDDDDTVMMYYEYKGDDVAKMKKDVEDLELLKRKVRKINKEQKINYEDEYPELIPLHSMIVIQVDHDIDITFFKAFLYSLKYLVANKNCLFIFSHGYYDDNINALIKNNSFSRYIQIYYPYSTQLFPNSFPGADHILCINNFECESSGLRYELFAQKKHFWWWKINYVFDKLEATKTYDHVIIFLEACQFVLRDLIYMTRLIEHAMVAICSQCEIISLGAHAPKKTQYDAGKVDVIASPWSVDIDSVGMAFNRSVWNSIKNYSSYFCNFNDYRWDASLRHLSLHRNQGPLIFVSIEAPRVIKYSKCAGSQECSPERLVEEMDNFARTVNEGIIPFYDKINIRKTKLRKKVKVKEIGGWEDDRDRGLCMYLSKS